MELSKDLLAQLHGRLLLMMREIHKICIDNDIKYTLMGGSLIGAVRHKGFIPWDDDLDIGMTYDNYQKFIDVVFKLKHDWLKFILSGKSSDYESEIVRILDTRTTLITHTGDNVRGLCIDCIPISYAGNNKLSALINFYYIRLFIALLSRKYNCYHGFKEPIMRWIANKISSGWLMDRINKFQKNINNKQTKLSSDFTGNIHGIVLTDYFDSYTMYQFENYKFMGISRADEYLRSVWGDYMQLPPENQRIPHHIEYLNLELPFMEYRSEKV